MVLSGHVKNGLIVLDDPVALPEGIAVSVAVAGSAETTTPVEAGSIWAAFTQISGAIPEQELARLPTDGAERHDQYLGLQAHDCP
jgi:hypothetical protein